MNDCEHSAPTVNLWPQDMRYSHNQQRNFHPKIFADVKKGFFGKAERSYPPRKPYNPIFGTHTFIGGDLKLTTVCTGN